ncbi:hypothetical protein T440DRAFT_442361 [Plenodomus tracheiphilus IPT5]|uniref:Fungal N-terminal domain-containing protein n=1 Tax=Plenodomus tracheiphilus IPT5 TaxID=1408161 RepID=A0A6A7BHN8_9PLEO|nr:hypothetical protein T440DRAFT_442361 [Plenodomus tracheiphilus IPT5]
MMAVLAAILPVVARSSSLAIEVYRVAASLQEAARDLVKVAQVINQFASNLKQIGTIIKEDDRLPSHESIEVLEDVTDQAQNVLDRIESAAAAVDAEQEDARYATSSSNRDHRQSRSTAGVRLSYLSAHLEALCATLSVQLQTLFTAQSIMWSKLRPTISPQQANRAVANERLQLQALIIEQQILILTAAKLCEESTSRSNGKLLMEADSSQSLVASESRNMPGPAQLYRYQDRYIATLDMSSSNEAGWLPAVSGIASSQSERLLERWTSLPQFDDRVLKAEREAQKQKLQDKQATVESDSEDEDGPVATLAGDGARRRRSGSVQPLFTDVDAKTPVSGKNYGSTAPLSPVESPRDLRDSLKSATDQSTTSSPRSSIGSLPVEAAAAVEAKEEDDDVDLEIPWTLCARKFYWEFVDAKQVGSNTDQPPSLAFLERNSWTEILASWVCKEAIKEAGYRYTPVQKDRKDGRRTKFETLFLIEKPLQFDQVKHLVERTVEIYRRDAPPTPPVAQVRRSSFNRPPPPKMNGIDRDRTPIPRNTHPPLDRSNTAFLAPLPGLPPLTRSTSTPGPGFPPPPPRSSNLQIPIPPGPYNPQLPPRPRSPHLPGYPTQPQPQPQQQSYTPQPQPQPPYPSSPSQYSYPPHHPPYLTPTSTSIPQAPLRQNQPQPQNPNHLHLHPHPHPPPRSTYDDTTTSESDCDRDRDRNKDRDGHRERERARQRRGASKDRRGYAYGEYREERERRKRGRTSKAAGALLGVGGLTALLDGLGGL